MYISQNELSTHLHTEQIATIAQGDMTLVVAAIDAAIAEAKGYLTAYDIAAELAKAGGERNALLVIFIKDIAVWHFINICNLNTSLELRQDRYNRAVAWLRQVQKGEVKVDLPALPDGEAAGVITFDSNTKRNNHY